MVAKLIVPEVQLREQLRDAISAAGSLVRQEDNIRIAQAAYETWDKRNELILDGAFTATGFLEIGPVDEYRSFVGLEFPLGVGAARTPTTDQIVHDVELKRGRLEVLLANLDVIPRDSDESITNLPAPDGPQHIFLVHGRDEATRLRVDNLVRRATSCVPVVLAEQTGGGSTIIEKIEAHLSIENIEMAVVIMTGDDVGALRVDPPSLRARARQNVVLELGYAMAALGRRRVVVLHEEGVEIPSDIQGVAYYSLDAAGAWQTRLLGELRSAGIEVDADALLDPDR